MSRVRLYTFDASMRPSRDEYYMLLARAAAARADCLSRHVGCVLVLNDHVISTGYNGTPKGAMNCSEGGCPRCQHRVPSGTGLDICLCVHAEANAVTLASRYGQGVEGAILYTTLQPCIDCTKLLIQAGVTSVYYREPYIGIVPEGSAPWMADTAAAYQSLLDDCGLTLTQLLEEPNR